MQKIKLFLINRQSIFIEGVVSVLSKGGKVEIMGTAQSYKEAMTMFVANASPEIVLVDLEDANAFNKNFYFQASRLLGHSRFLCKVSSVTEIESEIIKMYHNHEISGIIHNDSSIEEVIYAISEIARGSKYLPSRIYDEIIRHKEINLKVLTKRENDILMHLARGLSNKQISKELYITENTVKKHLTNIYLKLSLNSRAQTVLYILNNTHKMIQ